MKKINWRIILIICGLILFESICYLLAKLSPFSEMVLKSSLDNQLPLISWFVLFYIGWYLMLFIVPYILYIKDRNLFYKYISLFIGCVLLSSIIFFIFPTTIVRGDFEVCGISTFLLKIVYLVDTPALNCFPSMHCAVCFIFIYCACFIKKCPWYYRLLLIFLSIAVILSTILIKQHVIWDVIGALLLVIVVLILNYIFKIDARTVRYLKSLV